MTTSQIDRDRRRFPRLPHRLVVKYRAIGGAHHQESAFRQGTVINVSKGGLVLTAPKGFPPDTLFEIQIPESPLGPAREVKGKAVWTHKKGDPGDGGEFTVGCMFVRIVLPEATERRKFPRKPHKLPLSLCALHREGDSHEGQLQDLSQGGIEFMSNIDYAIGTVVQVGFPESPLGGARVVYVEIVRNGADPAGGYRIAGRFVTPK